MSSFFTLPASQRKRKRDDAVDGPISRRRPTAARPHTKSKSAQLQRDESISTGGSADEAGANGNDEGEGTSESESGGGDETGAQRRLRLAEQYLKNIQGEVNEIGFNAEDIDRDLIAERLQEDVAESKGRLYRHIASGLDFSTAIKTQFRGIAGPTTSIAVCSPYVYTVTKDMVLTKWELPPTSYFPKHKTPSKWASPPRARRPKQLVSRKGNRTQVESLSCSHHTGPILTVAASGSGKFVATGGADKRIIIWSATDLKPLKVFSQHRDSITSLAFRRGTNQMYSASKDRTIKTWSLDELAYVETLFGHQDEVVDVTALAKEQCLSVGARDRSARMWKVVEETQLVFRGGGIASSDRKRHQAHTAGGGDEDFSNIYLEGSIDRVALIDEETFITGSDNGSLCLWSLQKKKPIYTIPLAHGLDPPLKPEEVFSGESHDQKVPGEPQPRWITALATVSYSDLIVSGSWDGAIRVWRISGDKRRIEALGVIGKSEQQSSSQIKTTKDHLSETASPVSVKGIINDLTIFERGERGQDGLCVLAATGTEHRLGRWKKHDGRNGASLFEVPKMQSIEPTQGEQQPSIEPMSTAGY